MAYLVDFIQSFGNQRNLEILRPVLGWCLHLVLGLVIGLNRNFEIILLKEMVQTLPMPEVGTRWSLNMLSFGLKLEGWKAKSEEGAGIGNIFCTPLKWNWTQKSRTSWIPTDTKVWGAPLSLWEGLLGWLSRLGSPELETKRGAKPWFWSWRLGRVNRSLLLSRGSSHMSSRHLLLLWGRSKVLFCEFIKGYTRGFSVKSKRLAIT